MQFFTVPQLAKIIGVNRDTVLGWIRNRELAAFNVARRPSGRPSWRISTAALEDFQRGRAPLPAAKIGRPRKIG